MTVRKTSKIMANIFVKIIGNDEPVLLVEYIGKYYGAAYAAGDWTDISALLKELLSNSKFEHVWYVPDLQSERLGRPISMDDINNTDKFFQKHGHRPYYDQGYVVPIDDTRGCF